jgi:hypothetical protein
MAAGIDMRLAIPSAAFGRYQTGEAKQAFCLHNGGAYSNHSGGERHEGIVALRHQVWQLDRQAGVVSRTNALSSG